MSAGRELRAEGPDVIPLESPVYFCVDCARAYILGTGPTRGALPVIHGLTRGHTLVGVPTLGGVERGAVSTDEELCI